MPRRPSLCSVRAEIEHLTPSDQQILSDWLIQQLHDRKTQHYDGKIYVLQHRRCYRASCFCMDGDISIVGHGPYWYAYWNEGGQTQSEYIGKTPPWKIQVIN